MGLINCDYNAFLRMTEHRPVICYGVGGMLWEAEEEFRNTELGSRVCRLMDGDASKWNTSIHIFGTELEIVPPAQAASCHEDTVFLITSGACIEIIQDLQKYISDVVLVFIFPFLRSIQQDSNMLQAGQKQWRNRKEIQVIPKKIHYTWFSGEELPESMKKCKESWQKYCPDYELIEWNQENYDISRIPYVRQAIANKKWGFAGDYVRLDVVHRYGGVYLDLDVELVKSLDDLLVNDAYACFESEKFVNLGSGFGARTGFPLLKEMMNEYENTRFQREDKTLDLTASPIYQTRVLKRYGLKENGGLQEVAGITIYPFEYLCAQSVFTGIVYQTENTYSIHRFAASWIEPEKVKEREEKLRLLRMITI